MTAKNNFIGIILQPISNVKEPWLNYDDEDDFLTYFQSSFRKEIEDEFYVNHNTEDFADYLLIPYYTSNQKCFGAYYIEYGSKIKNNSYSHSYHIEYDRSFEFNKEVFKYEIMEEIEFNNGMISKVSNDNRTFYYKIEDLTEKSKNYILDL